MIKNMAALLLAVCLIFACPLQSFAAGTGGETVLLNAEEGSGSDDSSSDGGGSEGSSSDDSSSDTGSSDSGSSDSGSSDSGSSDDSSSDDSSSDDSSSDDSSSDAGSSDDSSSDDNSSDDSSSNDSSSDDSSSDDSGSVGETVNETVTSSTETEAAETEAAAETENAALTSVETEAEIQTEEESEYETEAELSTSTEGVMLRSPGSTTVRRYVDAKGMRQVDQDRFYAVHQIDIYEEASSDSRVVGTMQRDAVCYLLETTDDTWYFIESGDVRGFAQRADLKKDRPLVADGSEETDGKNGTAQTPVAIRFSNGLEPPVPVTLHASVVIPKEDNGAWLHTMTTTRRVIANKVYALAKEDLVMYQVCPKENDEEDSGTAAGQLTQEGLCFILEDDGGDWVFAESGDVRGYVRRDQIETGETVAAMISQKGETAFELAAPADERDEAAGYAASFRSVYPAVPEGFEEASVAELLEAAAGDPCDLYCDDPMAFAGEVYGAYGYAVGGTMADYRQAGETVNEAGVGDMILFDMGEAPSEEPAYAGIYAGDDRIIYADDEKVCAASAEEVKIAEIRSVLKRTTVIPASTDIHEKNAPEANYGRYLGTFSLTYYCPCAQCCDVATGLTATGVVAAQGETIAVDPSVIPYGTRVIVNGHIFIAQDCGGAIKGNRIDIFVSEHSMTNQSVVYGEVYILDN